MPSQNIVVRSLLLGIIVAGLNLTAPSPTSAAWQESAAANADEKQIQFKQFYKVEWRAIIEHYAEQAGLSLRIVDLPPTGTFDYQSDRWMTLKEGLDFLNQMLIQSDRVLIRNGDLLSLYDVTKGIPDDLIATVSADELDERGRYEVLNCNFDVTGLQAEELRSQLQPYISQHYRDNMTVIPAANVMIIQETGFKLRLIRDQILLPAMKSSGDWNVKKIELKHVSVEDVLPHAVAIGVKRDTLTNEDGSLVITPDPFDDSLLVSGNPEQIRRFERIAEAVDVPGSGDDLAPREPPFFQRYTVVGEAQKVHQILQTLLAGSPEVRLDFDEDSNQIYLFGRQEDHQKTLEVINKTEGSSDELAVLWIENMDVEDVITTLETLFRQTDPESTDGPVLSAENQNRLVVRGKPNDVAMVRNIVEKIDIPFVSRSSVATNRFIPMDGNELGRSMNLLGEMVPTLGLQNAIQVIQPDKRDLFYDHDRKMFEIRGASPTNSVPEVPDNTPGILEIDNRSDREPADSGSRDQSRNSRWSGLQLAGLLHPGLAMGGIVFQQEETGNGTGKSSEEDEEMVPDQDVPPSKTGAPITIRVTDYGIGLESEDYEALDKIESLILQNLDASLGGERIAFFLLKHLDANEAKKQLESYLGISGGGSAGGSPLGGLMSGVLGNALGGGTGDMVSSMLGGGAAGSSDAGVFLTEGPVAIVANVNNYSLAVSASPNDMELISQLIDFMDQPEAMHDPNPVGQTRIIQIRYQDVFKVEEIVKQNLSAILASSEQANGGGGNAEARAQQEMLRALLGRGRGGGGGGTEDAEPPKASLSVDEKNSALVVTGPKFAYDQILFLVNQIDVPQTEEPNAIVIIPRGSLDPRQVASLLKLQLPDYIVYDEEEAIEPAGNAQSGNAANGRANTPGAGRISPGMNMEAIQQLMRARNQGGNQGRNPGGAQRPGGQRPGGNNIPRGLGGDRGGNR